MAQTTSNVVPAAQTALKNMQTLNLGPSLAQLQQRNANISRLASPSLSITPSGQIAPKTIGTGPIANATQYGGMINPRTISPAIKQPLASATVQPAQTPEQFRASMGNPTTGPGSLDPTQNPQQKPVDYSGGTFDQSGNFTPAPPPVPPTTTTPYSATTPPTSQAGLIGSALGQAQTYYNRQAGLTQQAQDVASRIGQEQAATTGQFSGTVSDEAGRIAQLENIKQATMGQIQQQQATLAGYQAPLTSTYGTAIGAAQPQLGAYGQTFYQPLQAGQGGATGGAGVSPSDPFYATLQSYAQMAASGQISAIPSSVTSNPVLNAQMNAMAKQINPNFNPITSAAQGGVLSTIPAMQSANTAAKGIEQSITSFLNQNPQLNSSPLAAGNAAQQWIQGKQLADPNYQQLFNMLSEYTNTLAPILGVGGDPTNLKTQIAQGFINAQASGKSISQVLQGISQLADQKIQNLQSGATGGGVVASGIGGVSGGSGAITWDNIGD